MVVDLRRALRGVGKIFLVSGSLVVLFVVYQLWGTGFAEAQAQHRLRQELHATLRQAPPVSTPTTVSPKPNTTAVPLPPPPTGSAVAVIKIPHIGVNDAVVEGVGVGDLKEGPGHYPRTPLPGQPGNTAIAGHRTTYGAPFSRLDELHPGDDIFVSTRNGTFHYQVAFSHDVYPWQSQVIDPTPDNRLTLTTCTPKYSAAKRLIVVATLLGPATVAPTPVPSGPRPALSSAAPDAPFGSLSGGTESRAPAVAWGIVCALVWFAGYALGRGWRRWPAYAATAPVFLLALFVFFQNFARFVPANI